MFSILILDNYKVAKSVQRNLSVIKKGPLSYDSSPLLPTLCYLAERVFQESNQYGYINHDGTHLYEQEHCAHYLFSFRQLSMCTWQFSIVTSLPSSLSTLLPSVWRTAIVPISGNYVYYFVATGDVKGVLC